MSRPIRRPAARPKGVIAITHLDDEQRNIPNHPS